MGELKNAYPFGELWDKKYAANIQSRNVNPAVKKFDSFFFLVELLMFKTQKLEKMPAGP